MRWGGQSGAISRQSLSRVLRPSWPRCPQHQAEMETDGLGRGEVRRGRAAGPGTEGSSHLAARGWLQPPLQEASLPRAPSPPQCSLATRPPHPTPRLGLLSVAIGTRFLRVGNRCAFFGLFTPTGSRRRGTFTSKSRDPRVPVLSPSAPSPRRDSSRKDPSPCRSRTVSGLRRSRQSLPLPWWGRQGPWGLAGVS